MMISKEIIRKNGEKVTTKTSYGIGLGYLYQGKVYQDRHNGYYESVNTEWIKRDNGRGYMDIALKLL